MEIGYNASMQTRSVTLHSIKYFPSNARWRGSLPPLSPEHRYFEGIQGDNTKKGELFGIENIFKLHEDTLATKMAV
jgi:hypothetical protein